MRVLHVIPAVAPRYGGPSLAVLAMCRALRETGVDARLVTTDADGEGRLGVPLGREVEHEGVPTLFFRRRLGEALKHSAPLARWLGAHVREYDAVHVHAVFAHVTVAAGRASRRAGVPYVVRPLGTLDPWSLGQKALRKKLFWHLGARALLANAAAVHYTTLAERRVVEAALGLARGVVVPNGVDEELFSAQDGGALLRERHPTLGDEPYVLFLSRLHPKKGVEALLDAHAALGSAAPRLVIAGGGEPAYVRSLEARAMRSPAGRVVFTGWLDGALKRSALSGALLLALPSRQENFGIAVAEAMACGTPVLVSEEVNLADEVRAAGAGWVATRHELANVLATALSDGVERRRRGDAAGALARERFRWSRVAGALRDLYATLGGQSTT